MPRKITEKPKKEARVRPAPSPRRRKVSARLRFWRWPIMAGMMLVLMLVLFFAQLVRICDAIDDRLRSPLAAFLDAQVTRKFDLSDISIILVDADTRNGHPDRDDPGRNLPTGKSEVGHRHYHARLLKALAGTAKVVVFDVDFSSSRNPNDDEEFAAAIKQAEVENTRVLVAVNLNPGENAPRLSEPLKTAVGNNWGIWDGGGSRGLDPVRSISLGLQAPNQPQPHLETDEQLLIPSLALKAVEDFAYRNEKVQAFLDPIAQVVRLRRAADGSIVKSIRVKSGCYLTLNLVGKDELGRQNLYHDVYTNRADVTEFKNKIVVIGYQEGDTKIVLGSEKRYGAQIQANAISNILDDSFFEELGFLYGAAIIVLMIVIGAALRLGFGQMASVPVKLPFGIIDKSVQIPWMLLAVAGLYIVVVGIAYLQHTVFSITYSLLALSLSYFLIGAVRTRLGFE